EAADHDGLAAALQPVVLALDAGMPIRPVRGLELVDGATMSGELRHVHRMSGAGKTLRHVAHLRGRAAQSVDQKEAKPSPGKSNAQVGRSHVGGSRATNAVRPLAS